MSLEYAVHELVFVMDRAAERILAKATGLTYRRYLTLLMVRDLGPCTQRALAERLNTTEPSVSRMVGVLAGEGLLEVITPTGGGNRREVRLTDKGEVQVERSSRALAGSTQTLLERSGIDAAAYLRDTRRLIDTLAAKEA